MSAGQLELIFLGTGTSHGVPMIGCDCPVCRSDDPRDRRNRASVAIRGPAGQVILVDAAPELRLAAVACGLGRVDAIVFTAGIGENSSAIRASACAGLENLGIQIAPEKNATQSHAPRQIQSEKSSVKILVVPTDEELQIAVETVETIQRA